MGWIGQHIYDLASRFRSDVFLEDISTGTIASGAHLGLDSNNKIVKAVDGGGDLTAIVAGTGLSGTDLSGPIPTLNVDASQAQITRVGTLASGVWNADVIQSTYLDPDTMHLGVTQTITGEKTMGTNVKLNFRDANSYIHSRTANDLDIFATDIVLDAATSVKIETSDLTMYDPVNDGNPTISLGSSATNRFEIKTAYNSGAQTLDEVYFNSYTTSTTTNDGRFIFQVDEVELARFLDTGFIVSGNCTVNGDSIKNKNTTASSATEGGKLKLTCDDGAAMGDDHRLGVIEFEGAEDASNTRIVGASIQAMCDAAWSASENGTRLEFYTMDGNAASELSLTLDSDKLATFAGAVTVTGALSGTLATVSQPNITGVGTIGTGVWQGTAIAQAYIAGDAINGDKIADDAIDSEHYTDGSIDTAHIADDQVTFAKALGVTPNVFGNSIKLIPSDFMANDDGGNTKFGVGYVETAGAGYGMRVANNATELYAFVSIPQGMTATHVDIFDKNDLAVEVFEAQINATTMTSKGSGNANTTIDITDVASTATNFLAIEITTTSATNDKIYGGTVTIA